VPDAELPLLPFDEEVPEELPKAVAVVVALAFVVTDPVPVAVPVTLPDVEVCAVALLEEDAVLELDPEALARVLLLHDPELAILW